MDVYKYSFLVMIAFSRPTYAKISYELKTDKCELTLLSPQMTSDARVGIAEDVICSLNKKSEKFDCSFFEKGGAKASYSEEFSLESQDSKEIIFYSESINMRIRINKMKKSFNLSENYSAGGKLIQRECFGVALVK